MPEWIWLPENKYPDNQNCGISLMNDWSCSSFCVAQFCRDYSFEKEIDRSVVNSGNAARIAAAMKKAQNGETVTVGVIGGSITQGSGATSGANCYASLVKKWWEETFPQIQLTFINIGKGDTTSLMDVARVEEDLLCYSCQTYNALS